MPNIGEKLKILTEGRSSSARTSEAMMRGTQNDAAAVKSLEEQEFILGINKLTMLEEKDISCFASSPDGLEIIDFLKTDFASQQILNHSPTSCTIESKQALPRHHFLEKLKM